MPNKKCMYEGCDAPEYRKTGYCIRHKETGPRSIFIDTSKLVNEETNDDIEEIKKEDEEEVQVETEKESRKGDTKSKKKRKGKKSDILHNEIILPKKPDPSGTITGILVICFMNFLILLGDDEETICAFCCISTFTIIALWSTYSGKKRDYQNACVDKIEEQLKRMNKKYEPPKELPDLPNVLMYLFGFLAIICLFDDDTFGWSFLFGVFWFMSYLAYSSAVQKRTDFINKYLSDE